MINKENYYEKETNKKYMSVSLYKEINACEYKSHAKLYKNYKEEEKDCFIEGNYIHSWVEGKLEEFKLKNNLYKKDGTLLKKYEDIEKTILFLEKDKYFMAALNGENEKIFTGKLFGIDWKIRVDVINEKYGFITDLKYVKSIKDKIWNDEEKEKQNFIKYYKYDIQAAIYQEIVKQNLGYIFDFYIAAVSKEKNIDKEIIEFDQESLEKSLLYVEYNIERVIKVWKNEIKEEELKKCGECDYCRSNKKIINPINWKNI